jgi:hypothetical protein
MTVVDSTDLENDATGLAPIIALSTGCQELVSPLAVAA